MKMINGNLIHQMKGTQYPFGLINCETNDVKKIYIKKRYNFFQPTQDHQLKNKIQKIKTLSHKNTINLRSTQQGQDYIDLYYPYINFTLEDYFQDNYNHSVKQMHRQFIQMAIHLAKNGIMTTFQSQRCGVVLLENGSVVLKYYLPINQIILTDCINLLDKSVHIFNAQAITFLDSLYNQTCSHTILNQNSSQRTFKNRIKLFPNQINKIKKDSLPTVYKAVDRKMSNNATSQARKYSTLSRQLSEISEIHKKHRASTRVSGGSFNTFNSIVSFHSQKQQTAKVQSNPQKNQQKAQKIIQLKRCLSQNIIDRQSVLNLIDRSKKAIQNLKNLKSNLYSYKSLYQTIKNIKSQI